MFYTVIGNDNYQISDENKVKRTDGSELDLEIKDGKITIPLYGLIKTVELEWLKWLSYFKLELPKEYRKYIDYYIFKPIDLKSHKVTDPVVVLFKKPIYVKDDFRLIARYPRYAINEKCDVLVIHTGYVKKYTSKDNMYSHVSIYDQVKDKSSSYLLHRIVAFTWLDDSITNDFTKCPVINHIDGNKGNNHYSNLEWTSFSENSKHAKLTGLNPDGIMIKVYDLKLNTITFYNSVRDFCQHVGIKNKPHLRELVELHGQYLYEDRYLVRLASDTRDFDLENIDIRRDRVTVKIGNKKYKFKTLIEAFDHFNISTNRRKRSSVLKDILTKKFNTEVYINNDVNRMYYAKNITTNKIISGSLKEIAKLTGISKSAILVQTRRDKKHVINGYIIHDDDDFDSIEIINNTYKPVKVIAKNNSEKHEFNSLREAGRYFNCDMKTVKRALDNGYELNGYTLIKY